MEDFYFKPPLRRGCAADPGMMQDLYKSLPCVRGGGFCEAKLGRVVVNFVDIPLCGSVRDAHMGDFYFKPPLRGGLRSRPRDVVQNPYKASPVQGEVGFAKQNSEGL